MRARITALLIAAVIGLGLPLLIQSPADASTRGTNAGQAVCNSGGHSGYGLPDAGYNNIFYDSASTNWIRLEMYFNSGNNWACAVGYHADPILGVSKWTVVQLDAVQNTNEDSDQGNYTTYAGPVYVLGNGGAGNCFDGYAAAGTDGTHTAEANSICG